MAMSESSSSETPPRKAPAKRAAPKRAPRKKAAPGAKPAAKRTAPVRRPASRNPVDNAAAALSKRVQALIEENEQLKEQARELEAAWAKIEKALAGGVIAAKRAV